MLNWHPHCLPPEKFKTNAPHVLLLSCLLVYSDVFSASWFNKTLLHVTCIKTMASEALLSTFQDGEWKDYDAPCQTPTAVNKSLNALLWLGRRVTSQVSQNPKGGMNQFSFISASDAHSSLWLRASVWMYAGQDFFKKRKVRIKICFTCLVTCSASASLRLSMHAVGWQCCYWPISKSKHDAKYSSDAFLQAGCIPSRVPY